ncbi:ciliated left-right organizer protein containing ZP-N domains homolog [Amia ocellicauda]|uniref:ciliated left-right organizer protein containing ZP-N domains homolog n=1 Tax=Amia ocellicauda TaxID=2972642 RepID=UPI003463F356
MGRTIDILPLSLVSGYYAYSMEASCPNVSSSPAEETVLHISKRRMGLIKRGGYDKDSLTVNTVLVKQTNSFSVLENKEYLQISIPTAHILQEKNCTDPPGELFLQPFFKVDVIVTFKEMPYRFPWSIENVFPCVESQSTSPSSVAVTPAQEHKSTTANLYDTISTASAAARVGSTLDPRGPTDSSLYSKDARARESSSPSAEMALAADRGARAANPTPSPRELQPSEASTEGQESSTSVIAEWKTSAEQVTSTGARVDPSLALPTAVKVAWSLPELEHNPSWPSPLLLTSASQPTSSDVLVRTESGEYSTEPHPTGSETSIPYGDDPVLLTTSPHVGSKQLQEEKRGGGKLSSNCSEDESGSPTGLQSSARVEERVVEGNENHQISSPCGMAPPRISDLTSFNATKSPRFWEDNTSVEEDGSWTTTQPAPSTNKSPPLMASTSNNETTAAVTLLLYRFIAGETEMGDIPSEPSPHGNAEQDSTDNKQMQATAALPGTALGQRLSTTSLADTSEFQTSSSGTTSANRISVDVTAAMQHSSFSSAPWGSLPGQNGTDSPAQETGASFPTATTDHWA